MLHNTAIQIFEITNYNNEFWFVMIYVNNKQITHITNIRMSNSNKNWKNLKSIIESKISDYDYMLHKYKKKKGF
jgi:hypothetical protein